MPVPDTKNDPNSEIRVMVAPDESLKEASKTNVKIVALRHPKTGKAANYLINPHNNKIFEILSFEEEHRSWFIGSKVVSDGRIFLSTPINPVFLALPYISRSQKLVPLDQMLEDSEFPLSEEVLLAALGDKLEVVADRKGDKDLNVWKYNEEKVLEWLVGKVKNIGNVLEATGIDVTGGATSNIFKHSANTAATSIDYQKYGLGIVQEYISGELGEKLEVKLGLPVEEKVKPKQEVSKVKTEASKGNNKRTSSDPGENTPNKKIKMKVEGPTDDYSKSAKKAVVKDELSTKEKALASSAKGTKSIMSFFNKK